MSENLAKAPISLGSPTSRPWLSSRALPYLIFFGVLLYKQQFALSAIGLSRGPAMLLASAAALLILTPWLTMVPGRIQTLLAFLFDVVLTLSLYADVLYWRQFSDLASVASLRFAGQLASVGGSVANLVNRGDLKLFIDLPVLALLMLVPRPKAARWLTWKRVGVLALTGALLLGLVAKLDPLLKAKYFGHSNVASRMGLISYHMVDIGVYAERLALHSISSTKAVAQVNDWFKSRPSGTPSPLTGVAKGKNIIYIQVESLQAFTMGLVVNGQEITPNLNRLAKESLNFTDHYSQTGQGVTSDADLLGNCSLYPTRTGAVYFDYAANDFRCMPTLLREHGYQAVAMQGMPPDFWNLAQVYPRVGFGHYFNDKDFVLDDKIGIGLSDQSFFRQVIPKLKALPQPYYAFLVTLTSHGPFAFEGLPKTLQLGNLEGTQAADYLHAVHYTDAAIGQFLDALKAENMLDQSVIVLDGDHGGIFRQNSGMSDLLHIDSDDEVALTQMEKRVPLLIRLPGGQGAGERRQIAGQVDIAPTIAGLVGVDTGTVRFMGRDLLTHNDGVIAFYTGSAMTSSHLYWAKEGQPEGACYARPTDESVAAQQCTDMAATAANDLAVGRLIIERNLMGKLTLPVTQPPTAGVANGSRLDGSSSIK